jgi:hypothetical protein
VDGSKQVDHSCTVRFFLEELDQHTRLQVEPLNLVLFPMPFLDQIARSFRAGSDELIDKLKHPQPVLRPELEQIQIEPHGAAYCFALADEAVFSRQSIQQLSLSPSQLGGDRDRLQLERLESTGVDRVIRSCYPLICRTALWHHFLIGETCLTFLSPTVSYDWQCCANCGYSD